MTVIVHKYKFRRGLDADGATYTLDTAEPGWRTDTKRLYMGDASTAGGIGVVMLPDIGSTVQPYDPTLTAFAALTIAANSLTIGTGADAFSQTTFAANTFPARASTGSLEAKTINDSALAFLVDGLGASNTKVGTSAGVSITSATTATLVGWNAGSNITTGGNNTFVGWSAGRFATTASGNTSCGADAGRSITVGTSNVCVGYQSGYSTTSGANNTYIGVNSGFSATTGASNTCVGLNSGFAITTGIQNVFVGINSGRSTTTAASNTFIGTEAGYSATTGAENVCIGLGAGYNTTTGSTNVAIGKNAGRFHADGATALTTPANSVYIGQSCRGKDNSDSNSIVIGSGAIGQGANTAVWGNTSITDHYMTGTVRATAGHVSTGATSGSGYATGAGGTVTQATSRTTGVTINKVCGAITLVSAAGSTSWTSFTVTNSAVAATDVVIVSQKSGVDLYQVFVTAVAAGSFQITFATTGGTTTEQPVFNFAVIKAVTA